MRFSICYRMGTSLQWCYLLKVPVLIRSDRKYRLMGYQGKEEKIVTTANVDDSSLILETEESWQMFCYRYRFSLNYRSVIHTKFIAQIHLQLKSLIWMYQLCILLVWTMLGKVMCRGVQFVRHLTPKAAMCPKLHDVQKVEFDPSWSNMFFIRP